MDRIVARVLECHKIALIIKELLKNMKFPDKVKVLKVYEMSKTDVRSLKPSRSIRKKGSIYPQFSCVIYTMTLRNIVKLQIL